MGIEALLALSMGAVAMTWRRGEKEYECVCDICGCGDIRAEAEAKLAAAEADYTKLHKDAAGWLKESQAKLAAAEERIAALEAKVKRQAAQLERCGALILERLLKAQLKRCGELLAPHPELMAVLSKLGRIP